MARPWRPTQADAAECGAQSLSGHNSKTPRFGNTSQQQLQAEMGVGVGGQMGKVLRHRALQLGIELWMFVSEPRVHPRWLPASSRSEKSSKALDVALPLPIALPLIEPRNPTPFY